MNITEILAINDWATILTELKQDNFTDRTDIQANIDYYNNIHPILTDPDRANYTVDVNDEETGAVTSTKTIVKSKVILPIPRQIVGTGNAMTFGEPVELILNDDKDNTNKENFETLVNVWNNAGMDAFNNTLFRSVSVETKAAELIFVGNPKGNEDEKLDSIKSMLFSFEQGDTIYPHFNDQRVLDALTRVYQKRTVVDGKFKDVEVTEVYVAEGVYVREGEKGDLTLVALPYEKMVVVYYDQLYSEWHWIKGLIDKKELISSQFSDVNKRLGNPALVIQGEVVSMPDVGNDVKVFTTKLDQSVEGTPQFGDVKLVESKAANESIKQEQDDLSETIYKNTYPDFNKLMDEAASGNISIATMKLKFLNAFVKLGEKKPMYAEGLRQRINILKTILFKVTGKAAFLELDISVRFNSILPDNLTEILENIETAIQSGVLSQESGVYLNPQNSGNEATVLDELKNESGLEAGTVEI